MIRVALSRAVPDQRPRQKGMFFFALLFVLVAISSLSFYYAQLGLRPLPVASMAHGESGREAVAADGQGMPLGVAGELRGPEERISGSK